MLELGIELALLLEPRLEFELKLELDSELLLLLARLELLRPACVLLRLALLKLLVTAELTLVCKPVELAARLRVELLLALKELTGPLNEDEDEDEDEENTTNISLDIEGDVRFALDELTITEAPVELVITGPKLLVELAGSPEPPPQALRKTRLSQPRPN